MEQPSVPPAVPRTFEAHWVVPQNVQALSTMRIAPRGQAVLSINAVVICAPASDPSRRKSMSSRRMGCWQRKPKLGNVLKQSIQHVTRL